MSSSPTDPAGECLRGRELGVEEAPDDFDFGREDDADFVAEPRVLPGLGEDTAVMGDEAELFGDGSELDVSFEEEPFCDIFEIEGCFNRQIVQRHGHSLPNSNVVRQPVSFR